MEDWWVSLEMFDKVVWIIALTVSLIFLIQTVMAFIGTDSDASTNADFGDMTDDSNGPFQLFTFRNLINFFLGFSWTVIVLREQITNLTLLVLIASLVGVGVVGGIMCMFYFKGKRRQSGTVDIQQSIGKSADVYLTIPGYKNGMGKVHVKLQGSIRELDAITEADTLPSGSLVKVIAIIEERVLVVEKLN